MKLCAVALCWLMLTSAEAAPKILVLGHRGARAMRPENTIPGFVYAIAQGVDALELDVVVTQDDHVVVAHDLNMNRAICQGPAGRERAIRELTLAQVREWDCGSLKNPEFPNQQIVPGTRMPTLDEVFDLAPQGNFEFNVETKIDARYPELSPEPAAFARLVVEAVRRHHLQSRVVVQSFDFRILAEVRKLAPEIRLSALYMNLPKDFVRISQEAGGTPIVSPHWMLVTKNKVAAAHKAGLKVIAWTANTPGAWEKLIKAHVDGIITDDPAALIAYLRTKNPR